MSRMTPRQHAIAVAIERSANPSVEGSEIDLSKSVRTEFNSPKEAKRLLDSEDYKAGWKAAHTKLWGLLAFIMHPDRTSAELFKYAGKPKPLVPGETADRRGAPIPGPNEKT